MELRVARKVVFWYITLVGVNGETLMTSETYFSKSNAVRAANKLSRALKVSVNKGE